MHRAKEHASASENAADAQENAADLPERDKVMGGFALLSELIQERSRGSRKKDPSPHICESH